MTILIVGVFCVFLIVLAFVWPRAGDKAHQGGDGAAGVFQGGASKLPGALGKWGQKPFSSSRKAMSKSKQGGKKGRNKMPV